MALKPRFKKIKKNKSFFGRELYISSFENNLNEMRDNNYNLLFYHGIGGIGKTSLKNNFKSKSLENRFNIISDIDIEIDFTIENFYLKFITSVKSKMKLFYFNIAFSIYWSKIHPNQELNLDSLPFLEEGSTIAEGLNMIEGLGASTLGVNILNITKKYSKKMKLFFNDEYKQELEELNNMSLTEIESELPKFLSYDINIHMNNNRNDNLIFFIDTYEFLFEGFRNESKILEIDIWIRDLVLSLEKSNVLFCIMGREKLKWHLEDNEWNEIIEYKKLDEFSEVDSKSFLLSNGILEEDIIDSIVKQSKGVPFYLNLSIDTYFSLNEPKISDFDKTNNYSIFERFLRYSEKQEISTFKVLSFTKSFTKNLFIKLVKEFNTGFSITEFDNLIEYSFIQKINDNEYKLHDLMRESIQNNLNKEFKININKYLQEYYYEKINNKMLLSEKNDTNNFHNSFYHLLKYAEDNEINNFYKLNKKIFDYTESIFILKTFFTKSIKVLKNRENIDFFKLRYLYYSYMLKSKESLFNFNELQYSFTNNELKSEYYFVVALYYLNKNNNKNNYHIENNLKKSLKFKMNKSDNLKNLILLEMANFYRQTKKLSLSKKYFDLINLKNSSLKSSFNIELKKCYLLKAEDKIKKSIEKLLLLEENIKNSLLYDNSIILNIYYALSLFYNNDNNFNLSEKYNNLFLDKYSIKFPNYDNEKIFYIYRVKLNNFIQLGKTIELNIENKYLIYNYILHLLKTETINKEKVDIYYQWFYQNIKQEDILLYKKLIYNFIHITSKNNKWEEKQNELLSHFKLLLSETKENLSDSKIYIELSFLYEKIDKNNEEIIIIVKKSYKIYKDNKKDNEVNLAYKRLLYLYKNNNMIEYQKTYQDIILYLKDKNNEMKFKIIEDFYKNYIFESELEKIIFLEDVINTMKNKDLYIHFYYNFYYLLIKLYFNQNNYERAKSLIFEIKTYLLNIGINDTFKLYIDKLETILYDVYEFENNIEKMKECLISQIENRKFKNMDKNNYLKLSKAYFYLFEFLKKQQYPIKKRKKYLNLEIENLIKAKEFKNLKFKITKLIKLYGDTNIYFEKKEIKRLQKKMKDLNKK